MAVIDSQCGICKYEQYNNCPAFPEGMPDEIFENEIFHDRPMFGQKNDVVFEPDDIYLNPSDDLEKLVAELRKGDIDRMFGEGSWEKSIKRKK